MIGWTKTRKRCPEHGLVLRDKAGDCPACGKQLTVVSIPYLFQVYFHPAIMIVPGILAFLYGMGFFFDARGCIQADRVATAAKTAAQEAQHVDIVRNLPEDWQIVYPAILEARQHSFNMDSYAVLCDFLGPLEGGRKMSRLTPEEIRMFMQLMPLGLGDECFKLIMAHMGETR
mgnify:CR=1 FL=1